MDFTIQASNTNKEEKVYHTSGDLPIDAIIWAYSNIPTQYSIWIIKDTDNLFTYYVVKG